jgi:hypothetical protein
MAVKVINSTPTNGAQNVPRNVNGQLSVTFQFDESATLSDAFIENGGNKTPATPDPIGSQVNPNTPTTLLFPAQPGTAYNITIEGNSTGNGSGGGIGSSTISVQTT